MRPSALAAAFGCAITLTPPVWADAPAQTPQGVFDSAQALIDAQLALPELRVRIDEAEATLARGDAETAHTLFAGIAATYGEVPVAELGEVRALFAAGRFREAIAMGNLVVGESPGYADALATLAWIQDRAGYTPQSLAALDTARRRRPDDPILLAARAEILLDRGRANDVANELDAWLAANAATNDLLALRARADVMRGNHAGERGWRARAATVPRSERDGRWRLRYSGAPEEPAGPLSVLSNGILIDAGRRVITRTHALPVTASNGNDGTPASATIYVRRAGGTARAARIERMDEATGLTVLRLDVPEDAAVSLTRADLVDAPITGPCIALAFPTTSADDIVYPRMTPGFVANARLGSTPLLATTTTFAHQEGGGLLLDAAGRWIGVAVSADDPLDTATTRAMQFGTSPIAVRSDALLRAQLLPQAEGNAAPLTPHPSSTDAIYERVAPALVQVLGPAPPAR